MSMFGSIGGGLSALGIGAGIAAPVTLGATALGGGTEIFNSYMNWKNFQLQKDQYEYEKRLQSNIFAREDSSIQRRVADLTAAGLSPVLAAGSGAGSGAIVSTKAPQMDSMPNFALTMMSLLKMKEDIALTQAQKDLVQTNDAIKNWDLDKFVEYNLPSNASGLAKTIRDLGSLLSGITNQVSGPMRDLEQKIQPEGNKNPYKRPFTPETDPIQDWLIKRGYLPPRKR